MSEPDPLIGARLGEMVIETIVADGGFGTVYGARGGPHGRAAIKVLHGELSSSTQALARFEREIDAVRQIRHPAVVEIYAVGRTDDGRPWFAMELLEGRDLERHIACAGRLSLSEALDILGPLCEVTAAAHDAGIIHRDIKASNVFVTEDGQIKLLDFGIAKLANPAAGEGLTLSRQTLGTPSAMAPEQVGGSQAVTVRTDVYGLGALVYHLLVGRPPFADGSATLLQYLHCHAQRPRPSALAPLPPAIDAIVTCAMSIDPDRRQAGPRELLVALRGVAGHEAPTDQRAVEAVRVDIRLAAAGDDIDVDALDDAEVVWSAARAHFCTRGFVPVIEASESIVFVRPTGAGDGAVATAEFEALLAGRVGRHPAVSVEVLCKQAQAQFRGDSPVASSLLSSDW